MNSPAFKMGKQLPTVAFKTHILDARLLFDVIAKAAQKPSEPAGANADQRRYRNFLK
jgi:hypothetical protein